MQGVNVRGNDRIELEEAEPELSTFLQGVLDQFFTDVESAKSLLYSVARVADVAASPHVVRVKDVKPHHLARLVIDSHPGIGLSTEKVIGFLDGEFFDLGKGDSLAHDAVPDIHHRLAISCLILSDDDHWLKNWL